MRYSLEAEQSVIGAILINPKCLDDVREVISADDFYNHSNKVIFRSIIECVDKKIPIDPISIVESIPECAQMLPEIARIIESTPGSANVLAYAQIVSDRSLERFMISVGDAITSIGQDPSIVDVEDKLSACADQLSLIDQKVRVDEFENFDAILKRQIVDIDNKFRGESVPGVMTGFRDLDERFGGLGSDLMILAARPSMGKTTLALNICQNVAETGKDVLIFSLEVSKDDMTKKLLSAASGISFKKLRSGTLEQSEWGFLEAGVKRLKGLKIHIIDTAGIDCGHARNIAKKFARRGNLGLIMVDYLQLMTCKKSKSRFDEISDVSRTLKAITKDCKTPLLALSQLSRDVEKRSPPIPNNSDLRESGQIEQDADIISFIYREEYYYPDTANKNIAMIKTSKFRNGEIGDDYLTCQLWASRFLNISDGFVYREHSDKKQNSRFPKDFS